MIDLRLFFEAQLPCWPLAKANYDNLEQALFKDIYLSEHERIRLVCLPARIASSSAKITAKGEVDRPCFLCSHRLPAEQRHLDFGACDILVNPFPVFKQHFTVPSKAHQRQSFLKEWPCFYRLLEEIPQDYVVFFNGALCGASAPDHLHFQIGQKEVIPLQSDGFAAEHLQLIQEKKRIGLYRLRHYHRQAFLLKTSLSETSRENDLFETIQDLLQAFGQVGQIQAEDHINVVAWKDGQNLMMLIFPRATHRPACFYADDESQRFITSPASVEMMGYYIFPRQEDFHKADAQTLKQIYKDVCLSKEKMDAICSIIQSKL